MEEVARNEVLTAYYASLPAYERLATEIRRLFDAELDPSVPSGSIYTINHRLKTEARFLEKLEQASREAEVTRDNFSHYVRDLLGLRIVCLRLSDVQRLEQFIASLRDEEKLQFVEGPTRKKTFVLRVDPHEAAEEELDLQYSGYSSTHYLITLGRATGAPQQYLNLRAEIQIRTILEEAWGEIDHKYRYEIARSGRQLPDHLHRGFYSFAAYLQAAALHAEYLCSEAESIAVEPADEPDVRSRIEPLTGSHAPRLSALRALIKEIVGFEPSNRTVNYVVRRLQQHGILGEDISVVREELLNFQNLKTFDEIRKDFYQLPTFFDPRRRDLDLINALNFALIRRDHGDDVAASGLRSVLERRLGSETTYEIKLDGVRHDEVYYLPGVAKVGDVLNIKDGRYRIEEVAPSARATAMLICVSVEFDGD